MKIRSLYEMDKEAKQRTLFDGPSLTQQHFRNETDINAIMLKYRTTGFLVDPLTPRTKVPMYGDFSGVPDYQTAHIMIAQAKEAFEALPSYLRKRFNNDPRQFVEFCNDPANAEEMLKLGILEKREIEPVAPEPVVPVLSGEPKAGE